MTHDDLRQRIDAIDSKCCAFIHDDTQGGALTKTGLEALAIAREAVERLELVERAATIAPLLMLDMEVMAMAAKRSTMTIESVRKMLDSRFEKAQALWKNDSDLNDRYDAARLTDSLRPTQESPT